MRLLCYNYSAQKWQIEDFHGKRVPFYAILSHTWGPHDGIVTFETLQRPNMIRPTTLLSWTKLEFTRDKAAEDGLSYFWIDTCCIKKSDSTELQRSLNSMFYWYQRAVRCYVWLEDVFAEDETSGEMPWKKAFEGSRWFRRGWTLQELIAPKSVVFYSNDGKRLGDKQELAATLSAVTGIPTTALLGADLARFSKEKRLSWADGRVTKVPEDAAYSLIGIFGVTLPMLYADGNYARRKQAALDELDIVVERTYSRKGKPQDVVRIGGASFEDLRNLNHRQLRDLDVGLNKYIKWLDAKIDIPEDQTSEQLLRSRMVKGNGYARFEVEEKLQTLLKSHGVGYEFEAHCNQPEPFDIHNASAYDKLRWLEDAWHIFGYVATRTVLDIKIWIGSMSPV